MDPLKEKFGKLLRKGMEVAAKNKYLRGALKFVNSARKQLKSESNGRWRVR
jgi:hypothetical protein